MNIILLFPLAERDACKTKSEEELEGSESEKAHKGRHENENGRRMLQETSRGTSEEGTVNIQVKIKVLRPECRCMF